MTLKKIALLAAFSTLTALSFASQQGERCLLEDGRNGTCLSMSLCSRFLQTNTSWTRKNCSIEDYVCCPMIDYQGWILENSSNTHKELETPGATAEKWCEYYKNICPCSKGDNTNNHVVIVGGKPAHKEDFPHMAAIGYGPQNETTWQCGGSLISEDYVLTAAHCLSDGQYPAAWVRLGTVIVQDKSRKRMNSSKEGQTHPVLKRIAHPQYKKPSRYHDIALLKIGPAIEDDAYSTLSNRIYPACLHSGHYLYSAIATGWGRVGPWEDPAPILQMVYLLIYNNSECNKTYELEIRTTSQLRKGIHDSQICAGRIEGGEDTCQGDSGGPLQYFHHKGSCLHSVVGLTSFGKICGIKGTLGIYTRVAYYLKWIEENTWKGREICSVDKDHYGECLPLSNCTHIHQHIHSGYRPKQCGYDLKEPIVCCPSINQEIWVPPPGKLNQQNSSTTPGETAKQWCERYQREIRSMVAPEDNIPGNNPNYPHLAIVGYGELNQIHWECAGTLISEDFVLIAAHCLTNGKCNPAKWVRLGSKKIKSELRWTWKEGTVSGQVHPILGVIVHPEYSISSNFNDRALLKIGEAVEANASSTLSTSIHPACLQVSEKEISNISAVGLDSLGIEDRHQISIKEANVTVINVSLCNITNGGSTEQQEDQEMFFTCTRVDSWKGLCLFTLEGPLQIPIEHDSNLYEVMGLTASNQECVTGSPIAYTQIIPHLRWIEENVWKTTL